MSLTREIRRLLERSGRDVPLAEAALLVAKGERPALDPAPYLAKLDELGAMARRIAAAVPPEAGERGRIDAFGAYFFRDLGFRGNRRDYEDPENSYLDSVIERRLGLPITLSIVYVEVARRAGLAPRPVGFPGHFLVRWDLPGEPFPLMIDCFNAGRALSEMDLLRMVGPSLPFTSDLIREAEPRAVIARVLRNLKNVYANRHDAQRCYRVLSQLLLFEPAARAERRERGIVAAHLGRFDRALRDLAICLRDADPASEEAARLRGEMTAVRLRRAMLN